MEEGCSRSGVSPAAVPTIPEPVNGPIKAYDYKHRTFTRPYSAKTVFFYKEGDIYFTGLRVPVSKARYRNFDSLIDDLNTNISMPFGVRRVTTPFGRTPIQNIDQLEHLGRYVVSSTKTVRPLNLSLIDKIKKARKERHMQTSKPGGTSFWVPTSPNFNAKLRMSRAFGLSHLPQTAKQVLFVLNGRPSRIYRTVLNPMRKKTFEAILEEVSQGLNVAIFKIYAYNGKRLTTIEELMSLGEARVLAVPRNEKPKLRTRTSFQQQRALPSVSMSKPSDSTDSSLAFINDFSETKSPSHTETLSLDTDNSIEKKYMKRKWIVKKSPKVAAKNVRKPSAKKRRRSQGGSVDSIQQPDDEVLQSFADEKTNSVFVDKPPFDGNRNDTAESMTTDMTIEKPLYGDATLTDTIQGQNLEKQNEAASKIQKFYRRHCAQMSALEKINGSRNSAAIREENPLELEDELQLEENGLHLQANLDEEEYEENEEENFPFEESLNGEEPLVGEESQEPFVGEEPQERLVRKETEKGEEPENSDRSREDAAIKIQSAWRGYCVRRDFASLKKESPQKNEPEPERHPELETILEEKVSQDGSISRKKESIASDRLTETQSDIENGSKPTATYTVSVLTGNRWAAEMDKDLYIELHGENGDSGKQTLRQDTKEEKFRRNHVDSFLIETVYLGTLTKVIIGHDHYGYGAGVFIEQVLVTENVANGRQFLFQCNKWLDSGQVDGKTARVLKATAFYYISSIPSDDASTKGRWELILHSGKKDSTGGTTSNLNIIGYGKDDVSASNKIYDTKLAHVPSTSLVQIDFGEIGDLLKIRIEIDGNGDLPNYFLEKVELRDMDTDERMVSFVGKWLHWEASEPGQQPYREFPVFRAAFEPLNVVNYEGKLRLSAKNKAHLASDQGYLQIFGEFGDTGRFPIQLAAPANQKLEIAFKTEAVSVGLIRSVRLYVKIDKTGEEIYEGLCQLQTIYDNVVKMDMNTAMDWIVNDVLIRESQHTPYRFILQNSRVRPQEEETDEVFKEVIFTGMEGLATKISKKKAPKKNTPHWCLMMKATNRGLLVPKVTLCTQNSTTEMAVVDERPSEDLFCFEQRQADDKLLVKVRVSIDDAQQFRKDSVSDAAKSKDCLEIQKMTLYDKANGDELRFPELNAVLTAGSVCEFPAIWPDISPSAMTAYEIRVRTAESTGNFDVYINLIGTKGDIGFRKLSSKQRNLFKANATNEFSLNAVSIEIPTEVEVVLRCKEQQVRWSCKELSFYEINTNTIYSVRFEHHSEQMFVPQCDYRLPWYSDSTCSGSGHVQSFVFAHSPVMLSENSPQINNYVELNLE